MKTKTHTYTRNKKVEFKRDTRIKRFGRWIFTRIIIPADIAGVAFAGVAINNKFNHPINYHAEDSVVETIVKESGISEEDIARLKTSARQEVITELQYKLVDELAASCETKDRKEPDSTIIFDTNNEPSIGAWQYQRDTVIAYYKKFYGQDITRTEAIAIAIDHDKARELTRKILFEEEGEYYEGGYGNWTNCARKLNLPTRIQSLNEL